MLGEARPLSVCKALLWQSKEQGTSGEIPAYCYMVLILYAIGLCLTRQFEVHTFSLYDVSIIYDLGINFNSLNMWLI